MVIQQRMDPATYERIAGDAAYKLTELRDGIPTEKPVMSQRHGDLVVAIAAMLWSQTDASRLRVRANHAKLAISAGSYDIPDVVVLPAPRLTAGMDGADLDHEPALLVVEIWSPSTGDDDQTTKIPGYLLRGDAEIWLVEPGQRAIRRWIRRDDGGYDEPVSRGGEISPAAIPGVSLALDALFGAAE